MHTRSISFFLTLLISTITLSQRVINGKVNDANGEALIGVTVFNENTENGAVTDIDGNFSIAANQSDVLIIRMLGMKTQRITVGQQSSIDVTLVEDILITDEVVITGFQEVDRKLFTGASESLKMDDIRPQGMVDASRVLEGQVAGVNVDNVSGTFGTSARIRIRGNASINGNNQPLFVVDGVILEDLSNIDTDDLISGNANTLVSSSIANLNPNDIETFQVLKDASATAIYGARAANGVIVITTKKGKSGRLRVNYNGNYSVKLRPTYNQFDLLNSAEELSVYRELSRKGIVDISSSVRARNYGALGKMYTLIANHELNWGPGGGLNETFLNQYENANTDWFDVLFRDFGLQQQHSLSFMAGSEKSNSYYSISYLHDQGQTLADQVKRFTGTARNTYFISDQFIFGLKLGASYRDQTAPGTRNRELDPITGQFNRDFDINPYSYSLNTARSIRPFDENGNREFFRRNFAPFNILHELENNFIDIRVLDVSAQTDFEFTPRDNISLKGVLQVRYANTERDHTITENSNQAEAFRANGTQFIQQSNNLLFNDPDNPGLNPVVVLPQGGFKYFDRSDLLNFFSRVSGTWSKTYNEVHEVNALAGQELRLTNRTESSATGLGVVYESGGVVVTDPNIIEFFNLQNIDYFSLDQEKDRFIGWFLNGGYAYNSKYVANFTFRYDGSNQLGKSQEARFLPTWNVSGAWNMYNESFMDQVPFISDVRIRGTYGISGNLPPQASARLNLQSDVTIRPTDVEPYLFIAALTNEDLTWEKLKEFNVGVDFALFDRKIDVTFDHYIRNSFDLIGIVQTSGIGGQGLKVGNFADMEIIGYEFSINTTNYERNNFTWRSNINMGYSRDRITKLDFGPRYVDAVGQNGAAVLGRPRRSLYSANFSGLNDEGVPTFIDGNGEQVLQFDLQSREGIEDALVFEGSTEPRASGGFSNIVSYKGFSLNVLLSFKWGYKIRLNDAFFETYTDFDALPGQLVDRWAVPGDEELTNIPTIVDRNVAQADGNIVLAYRLYNKSTERVASGDYIRLKTVRLSYQLPTVMINKVGFDNANISLEAQNLALIYSDRENLRGQDPEFFSTGGVSLPQPKLITFSLNVGF
ncbi:SusC/RagA family TonB-linked outer membrane protein [Ekhidna lutea]|uniref:SusC/RagA family TonB-linked outer membrane protein n=1 Tax=Ekhidna lutea TaxID=447679 RepID=UPI0015C5F324|nr:SusC/RagA family TonB-linked outer membrane protein [Ekhidna lutea]